MEYLVEHSWKRKNAFKLLAGKYVDDGTSSIAVFTPVNPGARKFNDFENTYTSFSDKENYQQEKKLEQFLRKNGFRYIKANGFFEGDSEHSYIVRNLPKEIVERICKETFQDSFIYANVADEKITDINYYQTPGVEDSGEVHDYLNRGKGDSSVVIDTDPDQFAYTQVDKKSWINHFPHYDNNWENYENNGKWRKEYMNENTNPLKEGDVSGATCTTDGCIGDFAPEHICSVVTDITPTRKKIDEFFDKLDANMKALKEGKAPEKIDYESDFDDIAWKEAYLRKFEYPGTVRYPGDEEYNKLKAEWAEKRKLIHDKKVVEPLNRYPNHTHSIGTPDMHSKYDDGREDDFLAWYEDHKKEVTKPQLKEKGKKMKESFEDVNSDLYIVVAVNPESDVCARLNDWYADLHGWVDNDDAFTIRADEISDIIDDFGKDELEIYECPLDIAESEEPDFYLSRSELNETSRF